MKFRAFHVTNGTVFSGWFEPSRPSPSRTNFRAKIRNKQGNQKMADSLSILLALELLDDYEVEISEVLDEDDDITLFSVGSSYMRRNLNRVRDYFEGTIPLYFPDEFKGHFRMTRETCELFTRAVMPTGRIPLGNGSGRAAIPPPKQVLAFLWCMANQEPARAVADRFDITLSSHVEFDFRALRNWARAGMVEWNGIFRLFRFSGILGQPREVHPKFRNEIPENVCSIRSQTRNFRNFWSNGKRPIMFQWYGPFLSSQRVLVVFDPEVRWLLLRLLNVSENHFIFLGHDKPKTI